MSLTPLYELDEEVRDLIIRAQLGLRCDAEIVSKSEGAFGDVYQLQRTKNASPRFLAAKCPKIVRFGSKEKAVLALEKMLHEVDKTYKLFDCPWVNPFADICIIQGWPFLISQWRDGTLSDLVANPPALRLIDRLASLLQIVRVLQMAAERGLGAHQDLKPDNIFFVDWRRKFVGISDSPGIHYQILVGDFGNADAFREFGRNTGSRPYMAPEQFETESLKSTAGPAMDIFAVGVLAHECLCDGYHPIGEVTSEVWPHRIGVSKKWDRARVWRNWAKQEKKDLDRLKKNCPAELVSVISAAMDADAEKRPTPEKFEEILWKTLEFVDADAYETIQVQVKELESMYAGNQWPHFEERLASLHKFYKSL